MLSRKAYITIVCLLAGLAIGHILPPQRALQAADPAFVGVLALALEPEVAKKLDLSEEAKEKLVEFIAAREKEAVDLALELKGLSEAERAEKLAPFVAESEKEGLKFLTNAQKARLEEARVLKAGMDSLTEPKVVKALELTDEQKEDVGKLLADRTEALAKAAGDDERQKVRADHERKLQEVLTKEQRAVWERLAGVSVPEAEDPPGEARPDPRGVGVRPGAPAGRGTDPRAGARPEPKPGLPGPSKDGLIQFSFKYAPWKDTIEWFASQADLSLVGDFFPTGTFNYTDTKRYTPDEAIDILNSVLLTKGYTLVRRERMLFLIDVENNKVPEVFISMIPLEDLDKRGKYEMVKVLFPLKKMTLEEAERDVRKMLGPQGNLVALPAARQILVTESAGTLRAIRSMISAVEDPEVSREGDIVELKVQHLTPDEALAMLRPLLGIPDGQASLSDGSLRISSDPVGYRFIVTGKPEKIERMQSLMKMLDVGGVGSRNTPGSIIEQPQIEVYTISTADIEIVKAVFSTMLVGQPDVRLSVDAKTNSLVVMARPSMHASLKATLDQLQGAGAAPAVIQLYLLDPTGAVSLINKMFGAEAGVANAPKVEADIATRKLIIRGTQSQVAQIRAMLKDLGEDEALIAKSKEDRNTRVRVIPTAGSTRGLLEEIESLWPAVRSNPVVIQSSANRDGGSSFRPRSAPAESSPPQRESERKDPPLLKYDPTKPIIRRPEASVLPSGGFGRTVLRESRPRTLLAADDVTTFVAQLEDQPEAEKPQAEPETPKPADKEPAGDEPANEEPKAPVEKRIEGAKGAEIVVSVGPSGIVIASDDIEALNEFEDLLRTLIARNAGSAAGNFNVYYLKYAKADLAAELLMEIIGGAPADTGGPSLLGDMLGGNPLLGLLGFGSGGGTAATTPIKTSGQVSVVPDTRLNALVVQGNSADLTIVEKLLEVIDQEAGPESVETAGTPRMIMLENIPAQEAATVVQQVFASRIAGGAGGGGGGQNRQPNPAELIQALRGGGGGRNARSQRNDRSEPKMTLGVDARSNALIVSAPTPLFMEVKLLCEQLDHAGEDSSSSETTRVVTLKRANPELVQRALTSLTGGNVKTNTTQNLATQTQLAGQQRPGQGFQQQRPGQGFQQQPQMDFNTLIRGIAGGGQGGGNRGGGIGGQGGGARGGGIGGQGGGARGGGQGGGNRGGGRGAGGFQ